MDLNIILDIATRQFDCEKLKNKDSTTVLKAFKKICDKSDYLTIPKYSLITDSGTEFKGEFKKFFHDNNILLRVAIAGRHRQNIVAESAIRLISFLLINYNLSLYLYLNFLSVFKIFFFGLLLISTIL